MTPGYRTGLRKKSVEIVPVTDLTTGETCIRPGWGFSGVTVDVRICPIQGVNTVTIVTIRERRSVAKPIVDLMAVDANIRFG